MFALFSSFPISPVTAIQTRSKTTVKDVKVALDIDSIDTSQDKNIYTFLEGAKERADLVCNNTFTNIDGTLRKIPNTVEGWLIRESVRLLQAPLGLEQESAPHIGMAKWLDKLNYDEIMPFRINVGF